MKQYYFVDAVQKLGPEMRPDDLHDLRVDSRRILALLLQHQQISAEIGGHDDQDVAKINRPPLPIGQTAIVEHLQQDVEDVGMRLLDLIEENDLIGPAADRLR